MDAECPVANITWTFRKHQNISIKNTYSTKKTNLHCHMIVRFIIHSYSQYFFVLKNLSNSLHWDLPSYNVSPWSLRPSCHKNMIESLPFNHSEHAEHYVVKTWVKVYIKTFLLNTENVMQYTLGVSLSSLYCYC